LSDGVQRDQDKISELNQQLIRTARREELARQEMTEQKKSAAAFTASLTEKLKTAQKEKLELEAVLDKVCFHCDLLFVVVLNQELLLVILLLLCLLE